MITVIHEILSLLLLYTCFCRAVRMCTKTDRSVRLAFWTMSMSAVLCAFAPISFNWQPDFVSLALLISTVTVQMVTSSYWRQGVPEQFKQRVHNALH
jgi:hypothetical protein